MFNLVGTVNEIDFRKLISGEIVTLKFPILGKPVANVDLHLESGITVGKMIDILKEVLDEKYGN